MPMHFIVGHKGTNSIRILLVDLSEGILSMKVLQAVPRRRVAPVLHPTHFSHKMPWLFLGKKTGEPMGRYVGQNIYYSALKKNGVQRNWRHPSLAPL
jgi:hypothetical protein